MKIVQMLYYPGQGGAEQVSYLLAKEAIKNDDEMIYVFSEDGPFVERVKSLGCPIYFVKMRSPFDIKAIVELVGLFKKIKPDIIHTSFLRENFLAIIAGRVSGVKGIFSSVHRIEPKTKIQAFFNKLYSNGLTKFIVTSRVAEKYLLNEGVNKGKIVLVYNGIELPPEKINPKTKKDKVSIGFIGRLSEEKNVSLLLKAISGLKDKDRVEVLIVGDGPERGRLEKESEELSVDKLVSFKGYSDNPSQYYKKIDVLVLPSKIEVFPMVVLEALSYEVVVVSSDVGGVSEVIVDKENGFLFESQDFEGLTEIITNIINNPDMVNKISKNALLSAKNFSSKIMYEKTRKLYLEVLE
jgi:glycosyltransferase involved in cell wall biosynthesis